MTYQALQNQRLMDIAVAATGSRAGLQDILDLNPSYQSQPFVAPGDLINIPDDLYTTPGAKPTIVARLQQLGLIPATTKADPDGIGSMIIEGSNLTFRVS